MNKGTGVMQHSDTKKLSSPGAGAPLFVDALVQEIRRVDGWHSLGAAALAEALMPFIAALQQPSGWLPIESAPRDSKKPFANSNAIPKGTFVASSH